jgi:hypothetical protein
VSTSAAPVAMGRAVDAARQALRASLGARVRDAGPDRTETLAQDGDSLTTHANVQLLGGELRAIAITAPTHTGFEGFLDGIQRSATIAYVDGVPMLHGTAAAAIRERGDDARMTTWRTPAIDHALYASRSLLGEATWATIREALLARGHAVRDTDNSLAVPSRHPSALLRQGFDALSKQRDSLERSVGDAWCDAHAGRPLYVDGSLRTSHAMLRSAGVVGVVKSHARLYIPDEALPVLHALKAGERTSVIAALGDDQRVRFYTWYLRLRSAAGRDPFFGLIRAECGVQEMSELLAERHATSTSQWLLAERAPIAKPDARWDVMPYAIRDCEVYLRAVA